MRREPFGYITLMRKEVPDLIHVRCICHSLQLCSSYALSVLPRHIEHQVKETYNWFTNSTMRQKKFQAIYSTINVGEAPLKILKLSDTRWLSIAPCVQRILDQYDELKLHFQVEKETCYGADILFKMFNDPVINSICCF